MEMKCPESCKGCYREQTCELWKSTPLREDIEAEGCDYYSNHAPTNGDRIRSMSNEELAEILKRECPPGAKVDHSRPYSCKNCWLDWLNKPAEYVKHVNSDKEVRIYERGENLTGTVMAVVKPLYDYD